MQVTDLTADHKSSVTEACHGKPWGIKTTEVWSTEFPSHRIPYFANKTNHA
jgi:hypothetical protein